MPSFPCSYFPSVQSVIDILTVEIERMQILSINGEICAGTLMKLELGVLV